MNKKTISQKRIKDLSATRKIDEKSKKNMKNDEIKREENIYSKSREKEKKELLTSNSKINIVPLPILTENSLDYSPNKGIYSQSSSGNIKVLCRFRPLNEKEKNITQDLCVDFIDNLTCAIRSSGENNTYKFNFDRIFDCNANQQHVYEDSARSIINSVLEGFNGTIFAYGQTSSGKTHTMQGVIDNPEQEGIIPRMIHQVFNHILNSASDIEYIVKVSMIEIYMEKIKDLIDVNRVNLNVREEKSKGIYIEDLSEHYVISEEEVIELMKVGSENRSVGTTNMNAHSSRSHSIFIMTIHQNNLKDLSAKTGKLYLVDLAGSEKISKTGATGLTLEEAKTINKSLTTLGMVINSLTDGQSTHVPYRESKLTRVLQESLGGNAKTALIITCSPSVYNESETLSTLRFGLRAKKIKNKPKINKEVTVAELKKEIDKLDKILGKYKRRIIQLEMFIKKNGLQVPKEEEEIEEIVEKNEKILVDEIIAEDTEIDEESFTLNKEIENKQIQINELTEKYNHIESKFKLLEEEKFNITNKLHEANDKINEYNQDNSQAKKDEHNQMKIRYDETIQIQKDKIMQLEKIVDYNINSPRENIVVNVNNQNIVITNSDDFLSELYRLSEKNKELKNILQNFTKQPGLVKSGSKGESDTSINKKPLESEENVEDIPQNMEEFKIEKKKFQNEKKYILKTLEEKAERIAQLEIENKELYERSKLFESKINPDDRNYVKKIVSLEKNLEQINLMYHQLVSQKSDQKISLIVLEKKLKKKKDIITLQEKEIQQLNEQLKNLSEKMNLYQRGTIKNFTPNNVVKVLKGGQSFNINNIVKSTATYNLSLNQSDTNNPYRESLLKQEIAQEKIV